MLKQIKNNNVYITKESLLRGLEAKKECIIYVQKDIIKNDDKLNLKTLKKIDSIIFKDISFICKTRLLATEIQEKPYIRSSYKLLSRKDPLIKEIKTQLLLYNYYTSKIISNIDFFSHDPELINQISDFINDYTDIFNVPNIIEQDVINRYGRKISIVDILEIDYTDTTNKRDIEKAEKKIFEQIKKYKKEGRYTYDVERVMELKLSKLEKIWSKC